MDARVGSGTRQFGNFRFDRQAGKLTRRTAAGGWEPVALGARASDMLAVLTDRPGEVVSRDAIMDAVWPGAAVEPNNMTVQMAALRRALDEGCDGESCIRTVPGRGYRFVLPVAPVEEAVPAAAPAAVSHPRRRPQLGRVAAIAAVVVTMLLVIVAWQGGWFGTAPNAPRLSIVVLPFQNLSGDPKDDYLAEGITDDLTTELSNLVGAFVIARSSADAYRGKPVNVQQIGHELGVRYVLEGSMRRLGDVLRLNVQLVSAESGSHVWAGALDEPVNDLAAGQRELVTRLGNATGWELVRVEAARSARERPADPDAFDLYLRSRSLYNLPYSLERYEERKRLLEQAVRLDPSFAAAKAVLGGTLVNINTSRRTGVDPDEIARAAALISEAAAISPDSRLVLGPSVFLFRMQWHWSAALAAAQRMMDLYPNDGEANNQLATMKLAMGRLEEALPLLERSVRLDPRSQWVHERYQRIGYALTLLGRPQEAVPWLQRALASSPGYVGKRASIYLHLAAAQALAGHLVDAGQALAEAVRLVPLVTARAEFEWYGSDAAIAQTRRYQEVLRSLGLRDHADEDADFGIAPEAQPHRAIVGYTPTTAPGATTIRTDDLTSLLARSSPLVIDTLLGYTNRSLSGAIGLRWSGYGGDLSEAAQQRLRRKMAELTKGDTSLPIVAVGWSSERFDSYNLALRLVGLGYTRVYWYRGGREAWEAAGLPETKVDVQEW
jgi:TolB-like protein/DNA-binding winged helix-turn-helix (wHTH) protein